MIYVLNRVSDRKTCKICPVKALRGLQNAVGKVIGIDSKSDY
jgi:hypothetical protein